MAGGYSGGYDKVTSSIGGNATHFAVKVTPKDVDGTAGAGQMVQKLPLAEVRANDRGRSGRVVWWIGGMQREKSTEGRKNRQ